MSDRTASTAEADSITAALDVIGDRWSLLVLRGVFRGLHRFGELRDDLGIASNLLTTRLCRLVDAGVLEKVPYQDRPVRHEYRLTAAGRDLSPVLVALMQWGDRWRAPDGPPLRLKHKECGGALALELTCEGCGEAVDARHTEYEPGPGAKGGRRPRKAAAKS